MLETHAHHATTLTDGEDGRVVAPAEPRQPAHRRRVAALHWLSFAAAASVAIGGYVHFCLYRHGYSTIPVIGPGFLIQVISSAVLALALVVPWRARRIGHWLVHPASEVRLGALALSVGTLIAFGLTRRPGGLFNFQERGLQPAPQALVALLAEASALIFLTAALVLDRLDRGVGSGPPVPPGRPVPALARIRHR
jgi:hypothetical protein